MEMKINKYIFNVSNDDWVLDNGSCYQCVTLRHHSPSALMSRNYTAITIMSKKQFKELARLGILVEDTESYRKKHPNSYHCWGEIRLWRFNIKESENGKV